MNIIADIHVLLCFTRRTKKALKQNLNINHSNHSKMNSDIICSISYYLLSQVSFKLCFTDVNFANISMWFPKKSDLVPNWTIYVLCATTMYN